MNLIEREKKIRKIKEEEKKKEIKRRLEDVLLNLERSSIFLYEIDFNSDVLFDYLNTCVKELAEKYRKEGMNEEEIKEIINSYLKFDY